MKLGTPRRRPRGGFTLIELLTVVAILCILIALVVGAVGGIKNYWSRVATTQMFQSLSTALQQYYSEYSAYPWVNTAAPNTTLVTACADFKTVDVTLQPTSGTSGVAAVDQPAATLFNVLNARLGHGAAFPGGTPETLVKKTIGASSTVVYTYSVYVDGWGRQVYYWPPDLAATSPGRTRYAADGSTPVSYSLPTDSSGNTIPAYQCPICGWVSTAPGVCGNSKCPRIVNGGAAPALVTRWGPVLESLGALEYDDRDNMVFPYGTLK